MLNVPTWVWLLGLLFFGPKLWYAFQVGRRAKGEIRFRVRRTLVGLAAYFAGRFLAVKTGHSGFDSVVFGFVLALAVSFYFVRRPTRNRAIPKRTREAVIRRDLKGESFDGTMYHIDHIVPFSKGGDHSITNLRVLFKRRNLSRGAKMPKMSDFRKRKV